MDNMNNTDNTSNVEDTNNTDNVDNTSSVEDTNNINNVDSVENTDEGVVEEVKKPKNTQAKVIIIVILVFVIMLAVAIAVVIFSRDPKLVVNEDENTNVEEFESLRSDWVGTMQDYASANDSDYIIDFYTGPEEDVIAQYNGIKTEFGEFITESTTLHQRQTEIKIDLVITDEELAEFKELVNSYNEKWGVQ